LSFLAARSVEVPVGEPRDQSEQVTAHGLAAYFRPRRRDHKDGGAPRAGVAVDGRLAVARGDAGAAILEFARESDLIACRSGQTCPRARPGALLSHALKPWGQPVLIGGSMGTSSFVLTGAPESEAHAFASACHGAGRMMSRHQATRTWVGRQVIDELAARGIVVLSPSACGVAEEAPGAYKDVTAVVDAAEQAGLARKVARLVEVHDLAALPPANGQ
jgi:RNA-splicing ligase RtcB